MSREAMQLALEALEKTITAFGPGLTLQQKAAAALRQALETEQEPVLWLKTWFDGSVSALKTKSYAFADRELEPLYTAPLKREWVGLTDEEIQDLSYLSQKIDASNSEWFDRWGFARAIEAKLKEKNQ